MAKSALELAVETGKWDAGLKKAKSALDSFTEANGGLQKALAGDSSKMQQFVKMMGQTESTAKTAKGQMNDYKSSIEALTMQYNRMTDAQKKTIGQDYLRAIDQMKQKYQGVAEEVQKINQSLNSMPEPAAMSGGGLFGGGKMSGMLQVFGGNVMTKLAGAGMGFVTEMGDMVKQGIELARAGEGIRIAFERLGRGDILDGLRKATHGTVTDLELMKAAVKFNDFKLPLDELGTMLAFAQQKAKDTGQSVDYMVDSIVTGLGRKSLMILDNLGLSATEIRERMKETGDMTKAVGAIIREQMQKTGDYVETAADRAAQANVSLQNKMEELGRKFAPIEEASNQLWTSIKIGILDIVGGPLERLLNGLTRAGQLRNAIADAGGDERVTADINKLKGSNFKSQAFQMMLEKYSREEKAALNKWRQSQKGGMGSIAIWENQYLAAKSLREEFQSRGNAVVNPISNTNPLPVTVTTPTTGGSKGNTFDASKIAFMGGEGVKANPDQYFQSVWGMMGDEGLRQMMGIGKQQTDLGRVLKEYVTDPDKSKRSKISEEKTDAEILQGTQTMISSLQSIVGGINQLGIDIPQELNDIFGVLQTITGIVGSIQAMQQVGTWLGLFSHGGVVKAANGYVDGTTYSGDQIPAMLNAGEVVLNRSQAGVLAASLQSIGQGGDGGGARPYVNGEMIWLGLTNYLNRSGRGEIVTSRRK